MTDVNASIAKKGRAVSLAVGSALLTAGMAAVFTQNSMAEDFKQRIYINGGDWYDTGRA